MATNNDHNLNGLNNKVENEGVTNQGRLSASEFNHLVNAVIDSQERVEILENYFVPISETEYERLVDNEELEDRPYFVFEE